MKITFSRLAFALVVSVGFFSGCVKEGFDGDSSITGTASHHGQPIANTIVYIKFGATELPGTTPSDFDASVTANTNGVYLIEDLQKGNYYLYGIGYDSTISDVVKGGIKVTLGKDEEKTVPLSITEG